MHYMKWIYPRRLRNQMILMAILMVIVPTLTIGYIVETEGRSAVLSEKEKKLSAVVNLLNQALGNRRTRCPRHHGLLHHCPALLRRHFRHWFNAVLTATLQTEGI